MRRVKINRCAVKWYLAQIAQALHFANGGFWCQWSERRQISRAISPGKADIADRTRDTRWPPSLDLVGKDLIHRGVEIVVRSQECALLAG